MKGFGPAAIVRIAAKREQVRKRMIKPKEAYTAAELFEKFPAGRTRAETKEELSKRCDKVRRAMRHKADRARVLREKDPEVEFLKKLRRNAKLEVNSPGRVLARELSVRHMADQNTAPLLDDVVASCLKSELINSKRHLLRTMAVMKKSGQVVITRATTPEEQKKKHNQRRLCVSLTKKGLHTFKWIRQKERGELKPDREQKRIERVESLEKERQERIDAKLKTAKEKEPESQQTLATRALFRIVNLFRPSKWRQASA
ncbi:hypothetical protein NDN08_006172 [Rhodosorus marinus]|uniref:Ribosome biogenesis protein NOP53 n=1 Tax=Rhodosorus marinus TaxID=101924 RepID=A0AAV8UNH1_9RHOD|nr:hypothetical protein NDN08_006172 [Rhodosorus marinus]